MTILAIKSKKMNRLILFIIGSCIALSCSDGDKKSSFVMGKGTERVSSEVFVDTVTIRKGIFNREVFSTGKVRSSESISLRFNTNGVVRNINVSNGDRVSKGDVIATLDRTVSSMELEAAANSLEKAELNLMDKLVGYGYMTDTASVPKDLLSVVKIQSGYKDALLHYKMALFAYESSVLKAPFSGVIANLSALENESTSDIFCTLFNPDSLEVEFPLLESETEFMTIGTDALVFPFSNPASIVKGSVKEINPIVDSKGQVWLKAKLLPPYKELLNGMSVKIALRKAYPDLYVVPKSAVVIRDGYNVVFLYDKESSTARWLYVDILGSNTLEHVISGCIEKETSLPESGFVITSGNLNLADGVKVQIRKKNK